MKLHHATSAAALVSMLIVVPARAEPISDFALFGGTSTSIGSNVPVNGGFVGSNGSVSLGANVSTVGVLGGGNFSSLGNSVAHPTGNIVFNGDVSIPTIGVVSGSIDSGGNVTLGTVATIAGSIRAAGTVTVQDLSNVGGNIDAGAPAGTAVTLGALVQMPGTITHKPGTVVAAGVPLGTAPTIVSGTPTAPNAFGGVLFPAAHSFPAGVVDVAKPANMTTTLLPGTYDDVSLGANNVLNLTAGTYLFDTLAIGNNAVLNLDVTSGAIRMYFTGDVMIAANLVMNLLGGNASLVYAETLGDWLMGDNMNWFGTIYGSGEDSDVTIGSNHHLIGAAYAARELRLGDNSSVDYVGFDPGRGLQALAIPATTWLICLALAALAALRRREHVTP